MKPLGLVGVINALAHILISTSTVVALPLSRPDDVVGGLSEEQLTSRCHGHDQHQRVFNVLLYQREPCVGDAPPTYETPRPLVLLFDRKASEDEALEHESSPANTSGGEVVERRFVKPVGRFLKNLSFEDRLGLGGAIAGLLTFYPYAIASTISTAQTLDQMRAKKKEREELARLETAAAARASAAAASDPPTNVPSQPEPQEVHGHHHEHLESHNNSKDAAKQKPAPTGKPPVPPNGKTAGPKPAAKAGAPLPAASPNGATVTSSAPSPAVTKGKREPQSIDLSFPLLLRSHNFDLKIEPWNGDGRAAAAKAARSDPLQKRSPMPVNAPAQMQAFKRLIAISGLVVGISYLPNAGMTLFNTVQAMPDPEHERVKARLAVLRAQEEKAKADAQSQAKAKVDAQSQSKAKREMPVVEDEGRLIAVLVPWSPQTDGALLDTTGGDFVFGGDDDDDDDTTRRLIKEYLPYGDEAGEDFLKHVEAGYYVKQNHRDAHIDDRESDKQSSCEVRNSQRSEDQAQQLEYDKRQILPNGKVHRTHIRPAPFAKGLAILTFGGALGFFADKLVKHHMSHRVAVKEAIIAQASDKELAKDIYKTGVLENKGGLIATVAKRGFDDPSSSHDLIVWSSEEGTGGPGEAETSSTKRNDVKPPKEDLKTIVTAAESKELKYFKPKSKLTKTSAAALLNLGVLSGLVVHRWLTRDDDINKKLLPLVDAHLLHHPVPIPAPIPTTQSVKGVQPITVKARSLTLDDMPFQHSQGQDAMLKDVLEYLDNVSPAPGSTSMKPYAILYPATQEYDDHGDPEGVCRGERTTAPLGGSKTMEDRAMLMNDQQGGGVSERTDQSTLRGRPTVMTLSKVVHPLSELSERYPAYSTVQGTLSKRGLTLDGDRNEIRLQKRAKGNIRGVAKMVSNGFGRVGAGFGKMVNKLVDALNDKKAQALLTASFLYPAGVEVKNAIWKPGTEAAPETAQPTPLSPHSPHIPPSTTPTPQKTAPASTKKTGKTRTSKVTPLPATEAETEHTPLLPVVDVKNARDKEGKDPAMIKRARISGSSLKGLKKMGNLVGKGLGVLGKGFGKGQSKVVNTLNHPGMQAATTLTMFLPLAGQLGNSKPSPNPAKRSIDDHFGFMPSAERDLQISAKESWLTKRSSTYPGNGQESQPLLLPVNPYNAEQSGKVLVSPSEDSARFFTAPHEPRLEKRAEVKGAVTANVAASASLTKTPEKVTGSSTSTSNPTPPDPASEQQQEPQGIALTLNPKDVKPGGGKPKAKISFKTSPNNLFFSAETVMKRRGIPSVTVLSPLSTTSTRMVRRKRQAGRKDSEKDETFLPDNEKPLTFVKREPANGHSKVNYSSTKDGQVEFHGQADFLGQKEDKASLPQNVEVKYHKDPAGEAVTTVTLRTKGPNSAASASATSNH